MFAHLGGEAVHDGLAGVIGPVQDARGGVPPLPRKVEAAVGVAVKFHARALHQHAFHAARALAAEVTHGLAIVVVVPGHQNVFFQSAGVVGNGR